MTSKESQPKHHPLRKRGLARSNSIVHFAQQGSSDDLKEMRQLFVSMDQDSNGSLDRGEMMAAFHAMGIFPSEAEFRTMWAQLDQDGNGVVDWREFQVGLRWIRKGAQLHSVSSPAAKSGATAGGQKPPVRRPGLQRGKSLADFMSADDEAAVALFELLDSDHDGKVTRIELMSNVKALGLDMTKAEVESLWDALDEDGNGVLTMVEWRHAMGWLRRGSLMAQQAPADTQATTPQQKVDVLQAYVEQLADTAVTQAAAAWEARSFKTATKLLHVLDMPTIEAIGEFIGAPVVKPATLARFHALSTKVEEERLRRQQQKQ